MEIRLEGRGKAIGGEKNVASSSDYRPLNVIRLWGNGGTISGLE